MRISQKIGFLKKVIIRLLHKSFFFHKISLVIEKMDNFPYLTPFPIPWYSYKSSFYNSYFYIDFHFFDFVENLFSHTYVLD